MQATVLLLLAGRLRWRGSLQEFMRTLFRTFYNLSRDDRKFERKMLALEESGLPPAEPSTDADDAGRLALLKQDVPQQLAKLPRQQRDIASECFMHGGRMTEYAAKRGISDSTARTHAGRARKALEAGLAAYAGP